MNYTEETAHPEDREKVAVTMKNVIDRIKQKWNEYNKPIVSRNTTAMNLLLKLYRCIDDGKYKTSTVPSKFHNVFIMAYDTGADSRFLITRFFQGPRPTLKTCVAFTSIDGLDRSTTYSESTFESEYRYLHGTIEEETKRFLSFSPEKSIQQQIEEMRNRIEQLEVTVEELKNVKQERAKLNELIRTLGKLSIYIRKMAAEGTLDEKEGKCILQDVDVVMNRFTGDEESLKGTDKSSSSDDDETKNLRKHVKEIKHIVARHAKAINDLIEARDRIINMHDAIISARSQWEERVIEIESFANSLKRDEERLEAITEGASQKFVMEQYEQSSKFGKWCLRQAFPFIKELKLK